MSFRFMRIMVLFDLPVTTATDLRNYNEFRKYLLKNGYIMLQESIYTMVAINQSSALVAIQSLKSNSPEKGLIFAFSMTEKQFSDMVIITGNKQSTVLETCERIVLL